MAQNRTAVVYQGHDPSVTRPPHPLGVAWIPRTRRERTDTSLPLCSHRTPVGKDACGSPGLCSLRHPWQRVSLGSRGPRGQAPGGVTVQLG